VIDVFDSICLKKDTHNSKHHECDIESQVFSPAELFKYAPAGTRHIVAEI
jgi:hypothetical protein